MENSILNIVPIPFGLTGSATKVSLTWLTRPFFSDTFILRIELLSDNREALEIKDLTDLSMDDYIATGTSQKKRAISILASNGITVTD